MGSGKRIQAVALFGGGLVSALTIMLYATGYTREAAAIAVYSSLLGATYGATRVFVPAQRA